jgi:predicted SprT family Zn-dependent metalloprotease
MKGRDNHMAGAGVRVPNTVPDVPLPESNDPGTVTRWARSVMDSFGLNDWAFGWDNARRRLGACHYAKRLVSLSRHLVRLNGPAEIREVMLHEVSHALVGPGHGHGPVWRAMARRLGCRPARCGNADMPTGKWRATCPCCTRAFHRHKKPKRLTGWHCRVCGPERGTLAWAVSQASEGGRP